MYHMIEFDNASTTDADRDDSPSRRSEPIRARQITRAMVRLRPYVVEMDRELFEVADLYFEDGTVLPQVPYARFHFVD